MLQLWDGGAEAVGKDRTMVPHGIIVEDVPLPVCFVGREVVVECAVPLPKWVVMLGRAGMVNSVGQIGPMGVTVGVETVEDVVVL